MVLFNELIKQCIRYGRPMTFGKLGFIEASHLLRILDSKSVTWDNALGINAGVYPLDERTVRLWAAEYLNGIKSLDGVVVWNRHADPNNSSDDTLIERFNPVALRSERIEDLLPWDEGENAWHYSLAGKRVLVIHPFERTIRMQARKFSGLWPGASFSELIVVKPTLPPYVTGEPTSGNWPAALEESTRTIARLNYDFAVVGAGAYSLPLLRFIKAQGKPAVHLGGQTQLLFGIRGQRWEKEYDDTWKAQSRYNSSPLWVFPCEEDTPKHKNLIENGCYW
jgi:hypothetical protein